MTALSGIRYLSSRRLEVSVKSSFALLIALASAQEPSRLFINGMKLGQAQETELRRTYGMLGAPERYWYDASAGLWGFRECIVGGVHGDETPAIADILLEPGL